MSLKLKPILLGVVLILLRLEIRDYGEIFSFARASKNYLTKLQRGRMSLSSVDKRNSMVRAASMPAEVCFVSGGLSNGARRVRDLTAQGIWLSFKEKEKEYIIEQIVNCFPRINKKDLKTLDRLIEYGLIRADISPLTVKKAMEYIELLDKLNKQIFGIDYKPSKIKLNFVEVECWSAEIDLRAGIDKGILIIDIPIKAEFDSSKFITEMFHIYLHEDGHIKINLIEGSDGELYKPSTNEYWFYAISEGSLRSPFLELADYRVDFRDYLRRKGGIFQRLDPEGYEGRIRMLKLIHETLNNKLLSLVFGNHYSQAYIDVFRDIFQHNFNLQIQGLNVRAGILFLLRNLEEQVSTRILGDEELSQNFQSLAEIIIEKIDIPDYVKQNFRREYHELASDLLNLAESLYINSLFLNELSSYTDDINELFSLLNSLP